MKRIRMIVLASLLAVAPAAGVLAPHPAIACTGDPCDGFCDFWNQHPEIFKKFDHGQGCPLR